MRQVFRVICHVFIFCALLWTAIAVGNGKTGTFFGTEVFIASADDMMVALVGAIVGLLAWVGIVLVKPAREG